MKAMLICPDVRPAVRMLAEWEPLAAAPILGKSLLVYWIEFLAARGVRRILIVASDRPDRVRAAAGDGLRWGVQVEIIQEGRELSASDARSKYRAPDGGPWLEPPDDVILMDRLPGAPQFPLLESYAGWFAALREWMPLAPTLDRIGLREIRPKIWVGLGSRVSPLAQIKAPCWIGDQAVVEAGASIGPDAILEDRTMVAAEAQVSRSVVGPATFVGELTRIDHSFAQGASLIDWRNGSRLLVPDPTLLGPLAKPRSVAQAAGPVGRLLALMVMLVTAPLAHVLVIVARTRGEPVLRLRRAIRPRASVRSASDGTIEYGEFPRASGWMRRWPQLRNIVRGEFAWIGNPPLDPSEAGMLTCDFEKLWLTAPVGLISLADAEGCLERLSEAAFAHAGYYATHASRRLNWAIFARAVLRRAQEAWSRPAPRKISSPSIRPNVLKSQS